MNLDAATGRLRWYYQGVTNDFNDWDMQVSPISTRVAGIPAVIGSGKMGIVYAMNARTGGLLWKTPVGEHNGHDDLSLQLLEHETTISAPLTMLPGSLGGVLTDMALADGTVYAATIDLPLTTTDLRQPVGTKSTSTPSGEIVALNVATGAVEWSVKVPDLPTGAVTVSNDLALTTLDDGTLIALNRKTGAIVTQIKLPSSTNAPLAIAGNSVIIAAGAPKVSKTGAAGPPQLLSYTVSGQAGDR